jgi:dCMP deaminase
MKIAEEVAKRATCPRKRLGAVIVKEKRIIATGYNGSPPGIEHCDEAGCKLAPTLYELPDGKQKVVKHCVRTLHAEQNAIIQCAKHGASSEGATMYVTINPCYSCAKMIASAGITRLVYSDEYFHDDELDREALALLKQAGVSVEAFKKN